MEGIQLSVENKGPQTDISVIKVGGYIDTTTSSELEESLKRLIRAGKYNIIIDLSQVDYVSSAGWGIFISELKNLRERGGDLKLVGMIPDVYEVFELLEFHYILKAFDTIEEAIEDFSKSGVHVQAGSGVDALSGVTSSGEAPSAVVSDSSTAEVAEASGDLEEKVKQIVRERPDASIWAIKKELNTPRFGNVKIGYFALRKLLKKLGLDSKKKRMEFFAKSSVN
ncbi:MAG: STAS domain-containing protein [Calditrichaeota bacterium]|nr:STAS domain-containing protein [Calditrichota bacterium]